MERRQITFAREAGRRYGPPDLGPVKEVVASRIWDAMVAASARLTELGVRHALVGGLAVGAHGWPRATKDVDFLVDRAAWTVSPAGIVSPIPGLPIEVRGVAVDNISVGPQEVHLDEAIASATTSAGVPIVPVEALVYLKLRSPRPKDRLDVIELVRIGGIDPLPVRAYLERHAGELVSPFDRAVADAQIE